MEDHRVQETNQSWKRRTLRGQNSLQRWFPDQLSPTTSPRLLRNSTRTRQEAPSLRLELPASNTRLGSRTTRGRSRQRRIPRDLCPKRAEGGDRILGSILEKARL